MVADRFLGGGRGGAPTWRGALGRFFGLGGFLDWVDGGGSSEVLLFDIGGSCCFCVLCFLCFLCFLCLLFFLLGEGG